MSGFVMMYVPFPLLSEFERIERLPAIDVSRVRVSAGEALSKVQAKLDADDPVIIVKLIQPVVAPVYAIQAKRTGWHGVDAVSGDAVSVGEVQAVSAARQFAANEAISIERLDVDQWSVYPGLAPHRPLFAVDMADGGRHYVSSRTGEVLRDTFRFERGWNWVGSVIHWIYVTPVRANTTLWHWAVVVTSTYAILVALLGTVIGVQRLRVRGYASGRRSPYSGWMRWHHLLGLFGALFVFSWLISGLLSMNPFDVFTKVNRADYVNQRRGSSFSSANAASFALPAANTKDIREFEWLPHFEGAKVVMRSLDTQTSPLDSAQARVKQDVFRVSGTATQPVSISEASIREKASVLSAAAIQSIERIEQYDLYYYGRRTAKALPIWRIKFDDPSQTWWHIDATSGELVGALNRSTRVERWLYYGLHSWDWQPVWNRRPWAWDVPMVAALLLGTAFSLTSVVIAWRRIRSHFTR
jgi:hypothetical protein